MRRMFLSLLFAAGFLAPTGVLAQAFSTDTTAIVKEVHGVHNDVVTYGIAAEKKLDTLDTDLGAKLDTVHGDLQTLIKLLAATSTMALTTAPAPVITSSTPPIATSAPGTTPITIFAGVVSAFDPCAGTTGKWTTMMITPSVSIANAMACAAPGFNLLLEPGTYSQVAHLPGALAPANIGGDVANGGNADTVKVSGRGGCTVPQNNAGGCATKLAYGKGVFHTDGPMRFHDMEVRDGGINAMGDHDGQAGIYFEGGSGGTATVENVMLRNNENGIFSNNNATFDFVFKNDDFVGNGTDGGSHSSYMGGGKSLTLDGIHDYGSILGNNQKSRLPTVTATNIWSKSLQGRWIECADGCTLKVTGGTFIGSTCCQNVFGNGSESTSKGPGNTSWSGSVMWFGRAENFANAGTFNANGISLTCATGAFAANDHGGDLTGLPLCPANSNAPPPADVPYISGAKS